jgi:hypothetical protein
MITYDSASPLVDKHLAPDGSMHTSAGVSVAPASAEWAQRYMQASPTPDKWLNPDGTITAGNAGGGGSEPVYPGAGIAVSSGTDWAASLSATAPSFSTAYFSTDPTTVTQAANKRYVDSVRTQVIQSADEATAISDSTANPNNIYFWVE